MIQHIRMEMPAWLMGVLVALLVQQSQTPQDILNHIDQLEYPSQLWTERIDTTVLPLDNLKENFL